VTPPNKGEHLVRDLTLGDGHKCKLVCVVSDQRTYYKAFVEHEGKSDYIQLSRLPVDMIYMVYYLQETVSIKFDKN